MATLILLKYIVFHLKLIEWVQKYMNPPSPLEGDIISSYLGPQFRKEPQDFNGTAATLILLKYIVFHLKLIEWVQRYMNRMSPLEGDPISPYLGPHFRKEPQDFNGTVATLILLKNIVLHLKIIKCVQRYMNPLTPLE